METLSRRVIRGGLWVTALNLTGHLLGALRLLIVARLLSPHDFGLVGAAMVTISLLESLASGINLALIQRQHEGRELFDTAWTLGLIRGALVCALLVVFAPAVGRFVGADEAVAIVRVMALVPLARGLTNVGMVEFRKELSYRPYYLLHTSGVVAEFCVAVPLAFWLANAWALVGGWLAHVAVHLVMSYRLHPYRPALSLRRAQVRELLGYSRWIFGSVAISWLIMNSAHAVVGRLLGVQALGLYHVGWRIAFLPTTEVSGIIGSVTVAAYAKLQSAMARVRLAYLRVLTAVALVAAPIAIGFAVYGADLVRLFLGRQWMGVASVVPILAVAALFRAMSATAAPVFQGLDRARLQTLSAFTELVVLAAVLVPLTRWIGPVGAASAVNAASLGGAACSLWLLSRLLGIRAADLLSILGTPLLACLPFVAVAAWLRGPETLPGLVGAVLLSGILYLAALVGLDRLGLCDLDSVVPLRVWGARLVGAGRRPPR